MSTIDHNSPLTLEQQQRRCALSAAKDLLSGYQQSINAPYLLAVADWIIDRRMGPSLDEIADMFRRPTHNPDAAALGESEADRG